MEEKTRITTIKIDSETKGRLDKLKEHDRESYNDVIKKLLYILNIFRKNSLLGNKFLAGLDKSLKRRQAYEKQAENSN